MKEQMAAQIERVDALLYDLKEEFRQFHRRYSDSGPEGIAESAQQLLRAVRDLDQLAEQLVDHAAEVEVMDDVIEDEQRERDLDAQALWVDEDNKRRRIR